MKNQTFQKAVSLADKVTAIFVATADAQGIPHLAAAGKVKLIEPNTIAVTEWFCPGTVANVQANKQISVVIWDQTADTGYQLVGKVEKIDEMGILDGYAPQQEQKPPLPQVRRQLVIKVEKIIGFKLAPHSDVEN